MSSIDSIETINQFGGTHKSDLKLGDVRDVLHVLDHSVGRAPAAKQVAAKPKESVADDKVRSSGSEGTALASYDLSMLRGAKFSSGANKPLMRGEIGFIFDNQNLFAQNISQGLWLHNLIWAGLNSGGGIESYWNGPPTNGQIYKSGSHDYRSEYKQFYDFVSDIPLNNGNYQDIGAQVNNANLRVWGQKDLLNNRAHFWVQNRLHTWKNVADGIAIAPINETIKFIGFEVNKNYKVEKWQFSPLIVANESVLSNDQGEIDISIQNLTTDAAFKIGDYLPFDNCRTDKDGNKQINIADFFAAFDSFPVGAGDLVVVMQKWGKSCN